MDHGRNPAEAEAVEGAEEEGIEEEVEEASAKVPTEGGSRNLIQKQHAGSPAQLAFVLQPLHSIAELLSKLLLCKPRAPAARRRGCDWHKAFNPAFPAC